MAIVYKITNKVNGKIYIGQTTRTLDQRWKEHCRDAENETSLTYFHKAIKKHGANNFEKEILEDCIDDKIILDTESLYIIDLKSYDDNIGYNTTIHKRIENKADLDLSKDIHTLIENTDMSFAEIGAKFEIGRYTISSINRGFAYRVYEKDKYPLRISTISKRLNKDVVLCISEMLKNTKLSMNAIAEIYNTSEGTVKKINTGISYYSIVSNEFNIPIRIEQSKETPHKLVEECIYPDLKNTNLTLTEISNKHNVSLNVISDINAGISHKKHLEKLGATYPIRDTGMKKRFSEDMLQEVVEVILYTSLSLSKIMKIYDVGRSTVGRINRGERYGEKIKKFYHGEFPLRSNGNKKIRFSEDKKKKENKILEKYNIII